MTVVVILMGLPGSGKSTIAKALTHAMKDTKHVEYDEIEKGLGEADGLVAWKMARSVALETLRKALEDDDSLQCVIIDDNFYLRSMRKNVFGVCQRAAHNKQIHFGTIMVNTSLSECLKRNSLREDARKVPVSVIENMATKIELPDTKKAWWEKQHIELAGLSVVDCVHEVKKWLSETLCHHPLCAEVDKKKTSKTEVQESRIGELDKLMRTWVGKVASVDRSKVQNANTVRKHLLKELRKGADSSTDSVLASFSYQLKCDCGLEIAPSLLLAD